MGRYLLCSHLVWREEFKFWNLFPAFPLPHPWGRVGLSSGWMGSQVLSQLWPSCMCSQPEPMEKCKPSWINHAFTLLEEPPQLHWHLTSDRVFLNDSHAWTEVGYANTKLQWWHLILSCYTGWARMGLVKVCAKPGMESRNQPHICFFSISPYLV